MILHIIYINFQYNKIAYQGEYNGTTNKKIR